ncbi:MAG: SDR family NAD(P)-dependent oxidoreductase [Myxococcota bacterium]
MTNALPVLITGATGGLGRKTVLELAQRGRPLIVGGRRRDAVESLCAQVVQRTGTPARPFVADLADLGSVEAACDRVGNQPLHGIVTNAGLTTMKDLRSVDGYEMTFAVNVLAHHLLLCRLADQVASGGRIVVVSSGVHEPSNRLARISGIPVPRWVGTRALAQPDEAEPNHRLPRGPVRYSTSKLGNVLQARGIQARLRAADRSVDVFAIDPGLMVDTDLAREIPAALRWVFRLVGRIATPFVGNMRLSTVSAQHITSLIEDERWRGQGFAYLDGDRKKPPSDDALRDDLVEELFREAMPLLGLSPTQGSLPATWRQRQAPHPRA